MENKDTFKMTYSAKEREEIDRIRRKYLPREESKMEQLRALDARVNQRASRASISLGAIGAMVMGSGMSLVLSDLGTALGAAAFPLGIAVGVVGMAMLACAYPLYLRRLRKERERIAPEMLRLTEELMQ